MANHNVLIIIPTYNEAENFEALITEIVKYNKFDILIIDDNSPDGTGEIADQLATKFPEISVIHRVGKLGLGTAYVEGFNWSLARNYEYIMQMDCDFSHHPRYLPTFLEKITSVDLVVGSRYVKGGGTLNWGKIRKFVSRGGNTFARFMLGLKTHDCTGAFRCYRRDLLKKIPWEKIQLKGYAFQVGSMYHAEQVTNKIAEFPIIFEDRRVGQSKMSFKIMIEAFTYVVKMTLLPKFSYSE